MNIRNRLDIKPEQKVHKIKPTHGNCCTCQECGQNHDDCVCFENNKIEVCEYVEQLQTKLQELKEDNRSLEKREKNTDARLERLMRKIGDTQQKQIKKLQAELKKIKDQKK